MDPSRRRREAARKHLRALLANSAKAPRPLALLLVLLVLLPACLALLALFRGAGTRPAHSSSEPNIPRSWFAQGRTTPPLGKASSEHLTRPTSPAQTSSSSEDPAPDLVPQDPSLASSELEPLPGRPGPHASGGAGSSGDGGAPRVPQALGQPGAGPRPQLAFLFLTRSLPPLLPLWLRFLQGNEGEYSVYIQPVRKLPERAAHTLPPAFQTHVLPFFKASWGLMSVVEAERRLLAAALSDPRNTHFILVSESCIPLWPFPYIRDYLTAHPISFIDSAPDLSNRSFGMYTPAAFKALPPQDMRKGSQWFALRREHALLVAHDSEHFQMHQLNCKMLMRAKFRRCCADEYFAQTLLNVKDSAHISHFPTTYADWRGTTVRFTWVGRRKRRTTDQGTHKELNPSPLSGAGAEGRRLLSAGGEGAGTGTNSSGGLRVYPEHQTGSDSDTGSGSGSGRDSGSGMGEGGQANAAAHLLSREGVQRKGSRVRYQARVGDSWRGAMHPKLFDQKSISAHAIATMKRMTNFRQLRPYMGGVKVYNEIWSTRLPPDARTPLNGFCAIEGKPIHCFLFARKFHPSSLPFLLQHSQELFGY